VKCVVENASYNTFFSLMEEPSERKPVSSGAGSARVREMSIITQRGDDGMTDLMFGKRISKTSLRFSALGTIDELNAVIGLARASGCGGHLEILDRVQNLLFSLMGQLACLPEDAETYLEKGYSVVSSDNLEWLVETAGGIEKETPKLTHWAVPGAEGSMYCAHLDHARAVARRAERHVLELHDTEGGVPKTVRVFLNRLSDLMWILARSAGVDGE
jgi:cob(I)alamin adenosyltransferase